MANGSFGLSGLPTAPSTVGTVPNNALTPVTVAVNSVAGFQAGDLVYNVNGDVSAIPSNYVTSATFPIVDNAPVNVPNVNFGEQQTPPVTGGYQYRGTNSAKLTSGNIVIVYMGALAGNSNNVYFKIISETGTVVVAETLITSAAGTKGLGGTISVCALTGGGFATAWCIGSNNNVGYAIYSNTGTSVKAVTDSGFNTPNPTTYIYVHARPDGSWIASSILNNGSNNVAFAIYDATGTNLTGWLDSGNTNQNPQYQFDIVVRSDNTFILIYIGAPGLYWARYNTVGVFQSGGVITSTNPNYRTQWGGASLLTNGNIIITWGGGSGIYYSQLSTANTTSTATYFTTLSSYTQAGQYARPLALSNGNYVVVFRANNNTSQIQYTQIMSYIFCNSSNTILSASTGNYIYSGVSASNYTPTLVETASAVNVLFTPLTSQANPDTVQPNVVTQINWVQLNMSTYAVIPSTAVSVTVAQTGSQPVSGYARAGSTPSGAAFLASSSGNISVTTTQTTTAATLVVGQTTLTTDTSMLGWDATCLPDGTALILYGQNSGTLLRLAIISPSGSLTSTVNLATDVNTNSGIVNAIKITVLSDGKIACSYVKSSSLNTLTVLILSSTYSVLTTITATTDLANGAQYGCNIAALTNARFVASYISNGSINPQVVVWNSSGTQLLTATGPSPGSSQSPTVAGTRNGFLLAYTYNSGNSFRTMFYTETATNTWSAGTENTQTGPTQRLYGCKAITGPNGIIYNTAPTSTGADVLQWFQSPMVNSNTQYNYTITNVAAGNSTNGNSCVAQAVTGYGDVVILSWNSASTLNYFYNTAGMGVGASPTAQNISGLSFQSSIGSSKFVATGTTGHNVLVATANAAGSLTYFIFNPNAYSYTATLVAGTTPSNTTTLSAARGVTLLGVSTTAASANGTGTVQINGSAQLNSNYSATTTGQSFDFKNPVTFGAAGVISGRNVTLIGNV